MFTPKSLRLMASDTFCIYSNALNTQGCLASAGTRWSFTWTTGREVTNRLRGLTHSANEIEITYTVYGRQGELEEVQQTIQMTYTDLNFGGSKAWFLCECGKRVGTLYFTGRWFLCRHCGEVHYASKYESELERITFKMTKLVVQLRERYPDSNFPDDKPKRMREATFRRLADTYYEMYARWRELLAKKSGREYW